jgi:hypothetical protein
VGGKARGVTRHRIEPLSFLERIVFSAAASRDRARVAQLAPELERQLVAAGAIHEEGLAQRIDRRLSEEPRSAFAPLMGLTPKQSALLSFLYEGPYTVRDLETELADHAWAIGVRDWSRSGILVTLRALEKRHLVKRVDEQRPILWEMTPLAWKAMDLWLDAEEVEEFGVQSPVPERTP